MRYRQLGRTGLFVSELCLGAMTFRGGAGGADGPWQAVGALSQDETDAIVKRAVDAGINFIDTANVYHAGHSEMAVGQALKNLGVKRTDVVIATKVYGDMGPGPNEHGASRGHILDQVDASLKRLQTDYIDLYQIHAADVVTPLEETLRALDDLVCWGKVRYIGASNWEAWRVARSLGISERRGYARFETVQAYYTVANRDLERELAPMMREEQLGLMVWSPLAGGLLSGKFGPGIPDPPGARQSASALPQANRERAWACIPVMRRIAEAHDSTVARVALAWLLAQKVVTSLIVGVKTVAQLDDNLGAVTLSLSEAELAELDEVSKLPSEYPGWMVAFQAALRVPKPFDP